MDFITLNIKIANEQTQNICAIEIVEVQSRRIVLQKEWIIKPEILSISPLYARKYHFKLYDLMDAPTLPEIWPEILSLIQGKILFSHKAILNISILIKALKQYELTYPSCLVGCSLMLSKRLYPTLNSHQLNQLALELNLKQVSALKPKPSEATQIAQLLLHMAYTLGYFNLNDLLDYLNLTLGSIEPSNPSLFVLPTYDESVTHSPLSTKLQMEDSSLDTITCLQSPYDFQDKVVVLTGPLESMPRVDAVKKLHELGAIHSSSVTNKTQVILTNVKNPEQLPLDTLTSKLRRALMFKASGQSIDIINEETFLYAVNYFKNTP